MIVAGVLIAATCRNYGLRREAEGFATMAAAH